MKENRNKGLAFLGVVLIMTVLYFLQESTYYAIFSAVGGAVALLLLAYALWPFSLFL